MKRARRLGIALAPVLGLIAASAAAWACTALATLSVATTSAPAGSQVAITGKALEKAPVELHWNGAEGPVLGQAQGPNFTAMVTIPATAAAGTYYIEAVQHGAQGEHKIPVAFEVSAGPGAPAARPADRALQPSAHVSSSTPIAPIAGLLVLSIGVVAVSLGFAVVTLRRQRVAVAPRRTDDV